MPGAVRQTVIIANALGLHARASAKFCAVAGSYDAEVKVSTDEAQVSGTSIMGLMMLGAAHGCEITISASGPQADEAVSTLVRLVKEKFGEYA